MMLIKEGTDFYLLYTSSAQFICNGSMDNIRKILRKYAKKVKGSKVKFYQVIERISWGNNTYREHEKHITELWEQKYSDEYEEELEEMVNEILAENKVKTVIPKIKLLGKKEPPRRRGLIKLHR